MLIIGWLTLIISLRLGFEVARRLFLEDCRLTLLFVSPALALVSLLFSGTYLRSWLSPGASIFSALALAAIFLVALRKLTPPPSTTTPIDRSSAGFLALGIPLVVLYALFEQTTGMVINGDFFVHIASTGLFQEGHYPPQNYFLGIPAYGHFGRQLLIAQWADLTGLHFLQADWILTTLWQVLSFGLLFSLIRNSSRSQSQAMLGCGLAFFGANIGSRIGLADTVSNHNPAAYFFLVVATWAIFRALDIGGAAIPTAGLVLGMDAMIYELHFGLMGLSLPWVALATVKEGPLAALRRATLIGATALIVASTTGGTITEISSSILAPQKTERSSQQQQITAKFPKDELFQVRLDNMRPSRPFEGKLRPWGAEFAASTDYAPSAGKRIANLFWYPVWLCPLAILGLCWERNRCGIWFASMAVIAWLVPSVVDFGFFEGEALRWLYVSGLGGTICFGLALGTIWDRWPQKWGTKIVVAVCLFFCSAGLFLSLQDMIHALRNPGTPLPIGRPGVVEGTGLIPRPFKLLSHHYKFQHSDFSAAAWIRENTTIDSRILGDDDKFNTNHRCSVMGLEGRFPAAYLPQAQASAEPSGYRRRLQVNRFWLTGRTEYLRGLNIDWLVVHQVRHSKKVNREISSSEELQLEQEFDDIRLYRCRLEAAEAGSQKLEVLRSDLPKDFQAGKPSRLNLTIKNTGSEPLTWVTLAYETKSGLIGGPQWEPVNLAPNQTETLSFSVVSPYEKGDYTLKIFGGRQPRAEGNIFAPSDGRDLKDLSL